MIEINAPVPSPEDVSADTPCALAARSLLLPRLSAVPKLLKRAVNEPDDVEHVHRLRVATRRAAAALRLFEHVCEERPHRSLARQLRRIRRATNVAREADVHRERFLDDANALSEPLAGLCREVAAAIAPEQEEARRVMGDLHTRGAGRLIRKRAVDLLKRPRPVELGPRRDRHSGAAREPYTMADLAFARLPNLIEEAREAGAADLDDLDNVHDLRIAYKKLRYALELFSGSFGVRFHKDVYPRMQQFQDRLGELNDFHDIVGRLSALVGTRLGGEDADDDAADRSSHDGTAMSPLLAHYAEERDRRHKTFASWWRSHEPSKLFDDLTSLLVDPGMTRGDRSDIAPIPADMVESRSRRSRWGNGVLHRRVAAIDVGSNSIRLTVAETDPQIRFRIIEDMKETTRLGGGVYGGGSLKSAAMQRSLEVLAHMKSVAEGYHVDRIRAVGTSALREADNSDEFLNQVRDRCALPIDVIDAEREARLAFSSVASAFDLNHERVTVVDLGGGSAEVVLSSGGVVDAIHTLPLGAVRLTDEFGNKDDRGKYRFGDMCDAVDRVLNEALRHQAPPGGLMIGTGGTFTSLARLSILRGAHQAAGGRFPFALRGYEMSRSEVDELLDWLRRMSTDERRMVPGISAQRAEIIVAGLCVIERLMSRLGIGTLRIHDGGIRDGLLAEMIDELELQSETVRAEPTDVVNAARRFARRCGADMAHAEHVAALSMRMFDSLAAQAPDAASTWARRGFRDLLEAAALVHDVGLAIDTREHHRHGYDMIVHADWEGLTRREIEIIANLARYHRRGGPRRRHFNFLKLGDDDQRAAQHLVGILRIADALDRSRSQHVKDVTARLEPSCVRFEVRAGSDAAGDIDGAAEKADVFEAAFHAPASFVWTPTRERAVGGKA